MNHYIFIDGNYYDSQSAHIPFHSRGLLLGLGVFDSLLIRNGSPLHFTRHYERFTHDCGAVLGCPSKFEAEQCLHALTQLLQKNGLQQEDFVRARIQQIAGESPEFLGPVDGCIVSITATAFEKPATPPAVKAWIVKDFPRTAGCTLENCKRLDYTRAFAAMRIARENSADEPIMINTEGNISCASTSAIFIAEGDTLITPRLCDGILDSISRRLIIENMSAREESMSPARLQNADHIILTNTVRGARPVISLNGQEKSACPALLSDINEILFNS